MTPEQKEENYRLAEQLLAEQDFRKAAMMGSLVALGAAAFWAAIAAFSTKDPGVLAIGVGAAVGYAIQVFGNGIYTRYVFLASGITVAGCVLGAVLAAILAASIKHQIPVLELVSDVPVSGMAQVILADFGLINMAYWIIAISVAGYIAKRRMNRQQRLAMFTHRYRTDTEAP